MDECLLTDEQIRKLDRDLQILIATNGTLTRILNVVANDEIVVHIVTQHIHSGAPETPELKDSTIGRVLRRRILLKGRNSGAALVAAESLIAIDQLPSAIVASLTTTDCPIGEVMAANCVETFKETATVWLGQLPHWVVHAGVDNRRPSVVARRYRIITAGRPAIIITEYFLRNEFRDGSGAELEHRRHSAGGAAGG